MIYQCLGCPMMSYKSLYHTSTNLVQKYVLQLLMGRIMKSQESNLFAGNWWQNIFAERHSTFTTQNISAGQNCLLHSYMAPPFARTCLHIYMARHVDGYDNFCLQVYKWNQCDFAPLIWGHTWKRTTGKCQTKCNQCEYASLCTNALKTEEARKDA